MSDQTRVYVRPTKCDQGQGQSAPQEMSTEDMLRARVAELEAQLDAQDGAS